MSEFPTSAPTHVADFGGLQITFDDRILRPRAWTTAQSRWAADLLAATTPSGPVLELCAGAGHIGLLAVADSERRLVCVDLSQVACSFARRNAAEAGMAERVEVRQGGIDAMVHGDERFALVIADPPWVRHTEAGRYPEDPLLAIDGGDDGLDVARLCVAVARRHLGPGGALLLQLGTSEQVDLLGRELDGFAVSEVREYVGGVVALLTLI